MSLLDYDNCTSCDTFVQALSDSVLAIFVIALSLNDAICRFDHLWFLNAPEACSVTCWQWWRHHSVTVSVHFLVIAIYWRDMWRC